ncbi:MAG TPA: NAD-dependent epimerase/dehydratase family protein [Burkholderiaceae bacterium]|nr:NAD-dependent epimerase/dehydratase family protein [Burkholderiaceae bacterium]
MKNIHTVLGAGQVAKATVTSLQARGLTVRVVHRSGNFPQQAGVEVVAADVNNLTQLTTAFKDSAVVYMCAMPAYHRWAQEFDVMMANVLAACQANGSNLVFADNLYMYQESPNAALMETTPQHPITKKGVVRARIAKKVLDANHNSGIKTAIARASDFVGPGINNAMLGERFFPQLIAGKTVQWFGKTDVLHSYTYVPDFANALVELGVDGQGWGEAWHVPTCVTCTANEIALQVGLLVNKPAKIAPTGKWVLRLVGIFMPAAKEMIEMLPHFVTPYVVDSSKWLSRMQTKATPWDAALRSTVASFGQQ